LTSRKSELTLCNILGQAAGAFGLGELHRLWDSAALATRMCSCGEIVLNCPVWRRVLRACYGSADTDALRPTFAAIERHRDGCTRVRHMLPIPRAFAPSLDQHLRAYRQALEAIYASIGAVTGCQVAVDASKLPAYARVLLGCRLDVRVLFLVRDARATAYSWRRRKRTSVRGRTFTTAFVGRQRQRMADHQLGRRAPGARAAPRSAAARALRRPDAAASACAPANRALGRPGRG